MAEEWGENVRTWSGLNAHLLGHAGDDRAPSHSHEYMLYQTLLGAWPSDAIDAWEAHLRRVLIKFAAYYMNAAFIAH